MPDTPLNLGFEEAVAVFNSPSQNARVWTEQWVQSWLFCPNCGAQNIRRFERNRPVADFHCETCAEEYELKSQKGRFGRKVLDGAYASMIQRLAASNNPSLILMNYDLARLSVTNLFFVPRHFFVREVIEERKPLALTARRAGSDATSSWAKSRRAGKSSTSATASPCRARMCWSNGRRPSSSRTRASRPAAG